MLAEPTKGFSIKFRGYDPAAVDAHVEMLTTKQQLLHGDVESLRARLRESGNQVAELRNEVAVLTDSSPSPYAIQQRMAKMLRRTVEEVSEMQGEARAEAAELIAAARAEIEDEQRKHQEQLADLAAQREALEAECAKTKQDLAEELARMRADTEAALEEARQEAEHERERLLARAEQAVAELTQRRITILEQLVDVRRDLDAVPGALDAAYQERDDQSDVAVNGKAKAGR